MAREPLDCASNATTRNLRRLEPWVDGFAFEGEHAEHAFMHLGQVSVGDEPVECLDAESEFLPRERGLPSERPLAQSFEILRLEILRTVNDPQVLTAPALDPRLHEATLGVGDGLEGLDDHALAPTVGERAPPVRGLVHRAVVTEVDESAVGATQQLRVLLNERVDRFEMPAVRSAGQHLALRGKDLEGGELDPVEAVDIPAVPPVGLDVGTNVLCPFGRASREGFEINPPRCSASVSSRWAESSAAVPAAPVAAYWCWISSAAFADHGSNSASSTSQSVLRRPQSPAASTASLRRSNKVSVRAGSAKNGRPVRVTTTPAASFVIPNRSRAASQSRGEYQNGPRPHVFLLADDLIDADSPEVRERLVGVLQIVDALAGADGRHGRREVHQPSGIDRETDS